MKGTLLRIIAVIAFAAVVFPFMFSCDINTYGNISPLRMLFYVGIGTVPYLLGRLDAAVTKVHKKLRIPMRLIGVLTFGMGFLSLLIGGDGVTVFALGVCCVFAFFIGERAGFRNFADMFPLTAFAVYIVLTIACYIFVRVAANEEINETASDIVTAAFAIEFTVAALLVNQSGIFERANMRKETKASLPRTLTSYNAALVLGFTVTGLVLCVFRKQLAWVLEQAAVIIIRFIMWLWELFQPDPIGPDQIEHGEIVYGFGLNENEPILLEAFTVFALVVLAVIFRHKILSGIKGFFAWLGRLFGGRPEESSRPEFTDVFENYSSKRRTRRQSESIYSLLRIYRAETDPVKKFRCGYRIMLMRIKSVNDRLRPSDTVSVQAERGTEHYGAAMADISRSYDSVRYGELPPDEESLTEMEKAVNR